ncbi:hypothetical protein GGS21DRAFT_487808 [Xylaria nigripes]|nr:hypothetical protein GGS21DRAFT_487808 [Xylaria nigripes]
MRDLRASIKEGSLRQRSRNAMNPASVLRPRAATKAKKQRRHTRRFKGKVSSTRDLEANMAGPSQGAGDDMTALWDLDEEDHSRLIDLLHIYIFSPLGVRREDVPSRFELGFHYFTYDTAVHVTFVHPTYWTPELNVIRSIAVTVGHSVAADFAYATCWTRIMSDILMPAGIDCAFMVYKGRVAPEPADGRRRVRFRSTVLVGGDLAALKPAGPAGPSTSVREEREEMVERRTAIVRAKLARETDVRARHLYEYALWVQELGQPEFTAEYMPQGMRTLSG